MTADATPGSRPVLAADLEVVVRLLRRMNEEMAPYGRDPASPEPATWQSLAREVEASLGAEDRLGLLVGEEAALLTARVERPDPVFAPRRLLHVSAVYVAPPWRGRGLARQLLDEAFAWGRARGCVEVRLNVLVTNPAHRLYRELGFEDVRVEMRRGL